MAIIVLGVTGGIAAYKAADLTSRLKKAGHAVHVIMTHNAEHFISALTFETLSGNPVTTDTFLRDRPWEVEHVALAKAAELLLVAPATANIIGKFAHGIADDMLSTTYLATTAPVLLAPAMNDHMYQNEAVQANLDLLRQRGVHFIGPESGLLACGDEAIGRMSEPVDIAAAVEVLLKGAQTLAGKTVLVTAGPTREALDPVRYLTNRSSGRMGYALAAEAARRGAQVWLVSGPVRLSAPAGVKLVVWPAIRMAEEFGVPKAANTMMLAALKKLNCTGLSGESLETALVASFKKKPALGEKNRELLKKAEAAV